MQLSCFEADRRDGWTTAMDFASLLWCIVVELLERLCETSWSSQSFFLFPVSCVFVRDFSTLTFESRSHIQVVILRSGVGRGGLAWHESASTSEAHRATFGDVTAVVESAVVLTM